MDNKIELRQGRNCIFSIYVELVFYTIIKTDVFDEKALSLLSHIFERVCQDFEALLVEMRGETDHIHLLVEIPPKVSVSAIVNSLKCVSSRLLKKERKDLASKYWNGMLWSPTYMALSRLGNTGKPLNACQSDQSGSSSPGSQ